MTKAIEIVAILYVAIIVGVTIWYTIKSLLWRRKVNIMEKSIESIEYIVKPLERRINWKEYSTKNLERLESLDRLAECSEER